MCMRHLGSIAKVMVTHLGQTAEDEGHLQAPYVMLVTWLLRPLILYVIFQINSHLYV